ncbi:MAG: polysaccharide biosynthesis/export family protein [candidate division Zixibacteria bacterium]|nr:polysaccharide biosynthesis/export family protein [candidate division Zixibacteria bacterium]
MTGPKLAAILGRLVLSLIVVAPAGNLVFAADDYVIGAEDLLDISFFQDPGLNAVVKVGLNGKITLDVIGQIEAAGRTTDELQREIVRQMSRLNKDISQATVRVTEYHYNYVYVIGQVNGAGKRTFEEIPDLWTLINEAGGVGEQGDLSRVTIIRGGKDAGKIEVVDVGHALSTGQIDKLPRVRRTDTIEIPRTLGSTPSSDVVKQTEKKNVVYVVGAVVNPGPMTYEPGMDVVEVVALAGGPVAGADLTRTHLVKKDGPFAQTVRFDLVKYMNEGVPSRYIVQKEDVIIVSEHRPGFLSTNIGTVVAALGGVSTVVLIWSNIRNNGR